MVNNREINGVFHAIVAAVLRRGNGENNLIVATNRRHLIGFDARRHDAEADRRRTQERLTNFIGRGLFSFVPVRLGERRQDLPTVTRNPAVIDRPVCGRAAAAHLLVVGFYPIRRKRGRGDTQLVVTAVKRIFRTIGIGAEAKVHPLFRIGDWRDSYRIHIASVRIERRLVAVENESKVNPIVIKVVVFIDV